MESGATVSSTGFGASVAGNIAYRATVNAGDRFAASAENRATFKAGDRAAVKAEDRATVTAEARRNANAGDLATVKTEYLATVRAEDRATLNAVDRATVNFEARTIVKAEDRTTVNIEDRASVNAEVRTYVNAEDRATVKVEVGAAVNTEAGATVIAEAWETANAGDESAVEPAVRLARSRALFHGLDGTRTERTKDARPLAGMEPEQQPLETARIKLRNLARLERLRGPPNNHANEMNQRLSDEVSATDKGLNSLRTSSANGVCAGAVGVSVATPREGLLAKRGEARALARIDPQEMLREVSKRNREKRMALRAIRRQPKRAADARNDVQEMLKEIGKRNREKRMALRAIRRHPKRATDALKNADMELQEAIDGLASRAFCRLPSDEAIQKQLRARREDAEALAKVDPQERARDMARINRARRVAVCAIQRQRREMLLRERAKLSAARCSPLLSRGRNKWNEAKARACRRKAGILDTTIGASGVKRSQK